MAPTQLTHELFQSDSRPELKHSCLLARPSWPLEAESRQVARRLSSTREADVLRPRCPLQTLQRFATANTLHLDLLTTRAPLVLKGTTAVSVGTRLSALVALAEFAAQSHFPVLLAIDNFQALYSTATPSSAM
jgi:hypothetical protein